MVGSANGAKATRALATSKSTQRTEPTSALMGIGMGSVTHHVPIHPRMAASTCALGLMPGMGIR